ncbi:MAG TPA: alpha/beta hydrolase [Flavipsychrobacter sp.]|nr:alpha/beta hydrolase [Flavipsychrobacter sp.]
MYTLHSVKLTTCADIAYIDEGKGAKTLLFIHGLAGYSQVWEKNVETLKSQYRCIAVDLPGNGMSSFADYDYSISFFATCLKEFVEALKLKNLVVVGHSLGGQIAIYLTGTYPALAEGLVLVAPAGFETFNELDKNIYQSSFHFFNFFSSDENNLAKSITTSFYHYSDQADGLISNLQRLLKRYPARVYRAMIEKCIKGMLSEPVFHWLPLIQQRTLVIFGERDIFIPNRLLHPYNTRQVAETGVAQLKKGTLEMLPRSGHFVQWEKYKEVNRIIQEFMNEPKQ